MQEIKNAGKMMALKNDIEGLTNAIKNIEQDFEETLHKSIVRASGLVTLNNSLKEIELTSRVVAEYIRVDRAEDVEALMVTLSRQIYALEGLIPREVQRSMLKATEAMAEAEGGLLLMFSAGQLKKTFDKIRWNQ